MFPPEEMVTSLPIGSSIFVTHFLICNSLPDHIVASPSVACFKHKLSKFPFNE